VIIVFSQGFIFCLCIVNDTARPDYFGDSRSFPPSNSTKTGLIFCI
jgi:hypothetical protein